MQCYQLYIFAFSCVEKPRHPKQVSQSTLELVVLTALFCLRECVQCKAFGTGEKKDTCDRDCSYFNLIKVKDRDKLPQPVQAFPLMHCKERDANDCWFYYTYAVNNTEKEVHVVETLGEASYQYKQ